MGGRGIFCCQPARLRFYIGIIFLVQRKSQVFFVREILIDGLLGNSKPFGQGVYRKPQAFPAEAFDRFINNAVSHMETKPHFFVSVITRSVACVNPQRNFWGILWEERQRKGRARSKKSLVSAYRGPNKGFTVGGGGTGKL